MLKQRTGINTESPAVSPSALESTRTAVLAGFAAFDYGGLEVGGVLIGKRSAHGVTIEETRPFATEHAFGASLRLSEDDALLLELLLTDLQAEGLEAVGWYRSYTRRELSPTAGDIAVMARFFPHPGQVLLLLKPDRDQVSGLFFSRDEDGVLNLDPVGPQIDLQEKIVPVRESAERPQTDVAAKRRALKIPAAASTLATLVLGGVAGWWFSQPPVAPGERKPAAVIAPQAAQPTAELMLLKEKVADLSARNRRLEETVAILRTPAPPPHPKSKMPVGRRRPRRPE